MTGMILDLTYIWLGGVIVMMLVPLLDDEESYEWTVVVGYALGWPVVLGFWLYMRGKWEE
jgi:hypothetical protein